MYDFLKKEKKFFFGKEEYETFNKLKMYLAAKQVLAIYAPMAETELHCDASVSGYGVILLQKRDVGVWKSVFFSQRTMRIEIRSHSFELECLAVVYAIKRFHLYLSKIKFEIVTDCDSFRLTLSKRSINLRISRWALFLEDFDYEIIHRSGQCTNHVDALSRCHSILVIKGNTFEQTLSICQNKDEELCKIRNLLEKSELKRYELRNGLVYRKDNKKNLLFYVPDSIENNVIRSCHDDLGHLGDDKVLHNILKV